MDRLMTSPPPEAASCCDAPRHPKVQPGWRTAVNHRLYIGDLELESGETLRDAFVSYVMHGELNAQRSNAVLALSAIGSSHHRLDFMIGAGLAMDPAHACVICVDALGNGLSSSPSNSSAQPYEAFPQFSIRDMVKSQRLLVDHLGIATLRAVVGASMGGMQALQWAVSHPNAMSHLVAMTPMARTTPWSAAMNAAARGALMADPRWAQPGYFTRGLAGWIVLMQLIAGRTPDAVNEDFSVGDGVRSWIDQRVGWQTTQMAAPIDWIYQSYAYDAHDVGTTPSFAGDTARALSSIRARTLILSPPLDLYNPSPAARQVADGVPGARFEEIPSRRGHQSAGPSRPADADWINDTVGRFLKEPSQG
jgi:homoserine O-acetyltransferase